MKDRNKFILLCFFAGIFFYFGRTLHFSIENIHFFLNKIPSVYLYLFFVGFYVVGTFIVWHLKDILKIVGALLFGALGSSLLIYLAEIINAYIFFKIAEWGGKDYISKNVQGRFKKIYYKLKAFNIIWLFILRSVPLIPYRVLDMSFGFSGYSFSRYMLVVVFASFPRIFWIQFILSSLRGFSPDTFSVCFSGNIFSCMPKIVIGLQSYFMEHALITILSFLYFMVAFVVFFLAGRKMKHSEEVQKGSVDHAG
ncbi:MAG: VTT domain-containing protein [Candidatus Omnitrophota bacterium]